MTHLELFRCDAADGYVDELRVACGSFLEVADTFPNLVLSTMREAGWVMDGRLGKADRHYCPLHTSEASK